MSKYGNRKVVTATGLKFDSAAEFNRFVVLDDKQAYGEISDLKLQPEFEILPSFSYLGKEHYRAIKYRADFSYTENGRMVVEDVKGFATEAFKIKAKLFRYRYPEIELRVIEA